MEMAVAMATAGKCIYKLSGMRRNPLMPVPVLHQRKPYPTNRQLSAPNLKLAYSPTIQTCSEVLFKRRSTRLIPPSVKLYQDFIYVFGTHYIHKVAWGAKLRSNPKTCRLYEKAASM